MESSLPADQAAGVCGMLPCHRDPVVGALHQESCSKPVPLAGEGQKYSGCASDRQLVVAEAGQTRNYALMGHCPTLGS